MLHALCLHAPSLRSEGPPLSWNFQQIYPVIKNDNYCQAWFRFPELNHNFDDLILISIKPNFDDINWFNVSYLPHSSRGLTSYVQISGLYLRARVCIWREMKSLAHEILSFCKSVLNICLIKAQKANLM